MSASDGVAVHRFVLVDSGGHTWPGASPTADSDFLGPTIANYDAKEQAWAFFAAVKHGF